MSLLQEDFEDFFENSLCGYLVADPQGSIIRGNARLALWLDVTTAELKGKRFSDLLTIGGKIYYETHLWPLLRMQGFFDEVALELAGKNGEKLQVLVNAFERRNPDNEPEFIRVTIFKASDRRLYEQNLREARATAENNLSTERQQLTLREQLIAVLGHDLRNPLASIIGAAELLSRSPLTERDVKLLGILKKSTSRMAELIDNVMDFARTRLGGGIILNSKMTMLGPVLHQVVDEIRSAWPHRIINTEFDITEPVYCDAPRISQVLSNLLANAITHGSPDTPVIVRAFHREGIFELSVSNNGKPIAAADIDRLFQPFTREQSRPSQNGLGLGLYIASEITHAHKGKLTAVSTIEETRFTLRMTMNE